MLWSNVDRIEVEHDSPEQFVVFPNLLDWRVASWGARVTFQATRHRLEVAETYSRNLSGEIRQIINYHFMDSEGNRIFRFDTHGVMCPMTNPCHVHTRDDHEVLENGHGKLCGFDLCGMNFLRAFQLAYRLVFYDERLPWETQ